MGHVAVVGAGRLGTLLCAAFTEAGLRVSGPLRRGDTPPPPADVVFLAVPDAEIARAASAVPGGPLLAHCSGATGLEALGDRRGCSLHPLMTVTPGARPELLHGAFAAVAGTDAAALQAVRACADALGLTPITIAESDRAAYHAAASIAANFLVTLQDAAQRIGASAGLPSEALAPLVRAAVDNWAAAGARAALTGPVARGDEATVARQRDAVAHRTPELLELFDALTAATRTLVATPQPTESPAPALVMEAVTC